MFIDIDHVARLANLPLTPEEKELLLPQLKSIVLFIDKLNTVNTVGVEPTTQVTGKTNEFRPDSALPSLSKSQVLANAPLKSADHIVTKGVFTND